MTRLLPILLTLTCLPLSNAFARQKFERKVKNVTESEVSSPVPVIFGKKSDGLPETMKVRGRISEVSFSRACGVILWSGTLKVKLLDKTEGYPYEYAFIVVNCLEDSQNEAKYLDKVVEMNVSKLYPKYRKYRGAKTFYFELIDNTINSGGVPFYCTSMGRDETLKNIERQAK